MKASADNNYQYLDESKLRNIQCIACEDVRRQNYQLKQQLCELEEREYGISETEKELAAIKELYELKCQ